MSLWHANHAVPKFTKYPTMRFHSCTVDMMILILLIMTTIVKLIQVISCNWRMSHMEPSANNLFCFVFRNNFSIKSVHWQQKGKSSYIFTCLYSIVHISMLKHLTICPLWCHRGHWNLINTSPRLHPCQMFVPSSEILHGCLVFFLSPLLNN